ncbi:MAG: hypothetical protein ACREYA_07450, partial [Cupriavidus necator]
GLVRGRLNGRRRRHGCRLSGQDRARSQRQGRRYEQFAQAMEWGCLHGTVGFAIGSLSAAAGGSGPARRQPGGEVWLSSGKMPHAGRPLAAVQKQFITPFGSVQIGTRPRGALL